LAALLIELLDLPFVILNELITSSSFLPLSGLVSFY
jgi:hypothetical protein